jgi:hypothetical protein
MTTHELKNAIQRLQAEQALASIEGLSGVATYMADLDAELAAARSAYVGAAVTEIASFRAQLSGPLRG